MSKEQTQKEYDLSIRSRETQDESRQTIDGFIREIGLNRDLDISVASENSHELAKICVLTDIADNLKEQSVAIWNISRTLDNINSNLQYNK